MTISPVDVLEAHVNLKGVVRQTPLMHSEGLSELSGADVFLKLENLQITGSFKLRGAYNRMMALAEDERGEVITASAGNHGIAVAFVARRMGWRAAIVMPRSAPKTKVARCRALGAEVVLEGEYYDESLAYCTSMAAERGATYIPATEDHRVMAGQGTVGYEVLEEMPTTDTLVVPIGGGGLIAGTALWAKSVNPQIRVLGAQSTAARSMHEAFRAGRVVEVPYVPTLADGLAGGVTQMKLDLALEYVDDIVLATEGKLRDSILWLLRHEHQLVEGAAIVGLAAMLEGKLVFRPGERVVLVLSGGNVDPDVLGLPVGAMG